MEKLNKVFQPKEVLKSADLNAMVGKTNELVEALDSGGLDVAIAKGQQDNAVIENNTTLHLFDSGEHINQAGWYSHAEGISTNASGNVSHAEGYKSKAIGKFSHAEGYESKAIGEASHAEGFLTTASGDCSHTEGYSTTASGLHSHAEGESTNAEGKCSHAEGLQTTASNYYSSAHGHGTIADTECGFAIGSFNVSTNKPDAKTIFSIGIGENGYRENAFEVLKDGRIYMLNAFGYNGKNAGDNNVYPVNEAIKNLLDDVEFLKMRVKRLEEGNVDLPSDFNNDFNNDYGM